ncbi:MAG: hypothetical protein R3257_03605, partial [bacterium]|nr:hypothetical protein [bacterium]
MDPVSAPFPSSGVAKASELGLKVERRVSALLEEATDPALLAAMAAAQLSFPLTRHGLWKSLPKSFGHGSSVLRVGTATLGAFATEGLAFVGTHRSLAQASGISWREELRHTYLTLGLLRAFGGSTAQALRSAKLRHPVLLQGAPQASAYAGIYLSNSLASYLHWAEPMASGENGIQSLLTLIQFKGVEGILRLSPSFQGLHFPIQQASDRMIQGSRLLPSPFGSGIGPQRGPLWGGEGWALAAARNPRALSNPHLVFMDGSRSTGVSHFGIRIKSGEGYNWSKNARPDLAQLEAMIGETLQREFGSTLSGMNANTLTGRVIRFPDGKGVVWETLLKQYSHARWLRDHPGEYLSQRKAYEQRGYTVADSYDYFIREVLKQGPAEEFQLSSGEGYPWKKGAPPQIGPLEKMLKEILFVQFAGDVAKVNFNQIAKKIYLMPDGKTVSGRRILYQYAYARFLREHPGHRGSREQALRTQGYTPNDALQVFLRQHRHTPVSALLHSLAETAPATHTAKSSDPILDPLIFRSADYGPKAKRDPVTAERAFYHSLLRNSDKKLRDDLFYWVSGPALESALKVYASWEGLKHLPRGFRLGSVRVRAGQIKKLQSGQLTERDWRDIN